MGGYKPLARELLPDAAGELRRQRPNSCGPERAVRGPPFHSLPLRPVSPPELGPLDDVVDDPSRNRLAVQACSGLSERARKRLRNSAYPPSLMKTDHRPGEPALQAVRNRVGRTQYPRVERPARPKEPLQNTMNRCGTIYGFSTCSRQSGVRRAPLTTYGSAQEWSGLCLRQSGVFPGPRGEP